MFALRPVLPRACGPCVQPCNRACVQSYNRACMRMCRPFAARYLAALRARVMRAREARTHWGAGPELSRMQQDLIDALRENPIITLTELGETLGKKPNAVRVLIQRTEEKLGHPIFRRGSTKPPSRVDKSDKPERAPKERAPLTRAAVEKIAAVQEAREVEEHKREVEQAAKAREPPPEPLTERPPGTTPLEIGYEATKAAAPPDREPYNKPPQCS